MNHDIDQHAQTCTEKPAVVRKYSFHWDGVPFYEGELPSLFRLGVRLCLTF